MARDKNPVGNPESVALVQQAHGGALKRGGTKGPGRPSNKLRAELRRGALQNVSFLKRLASGKIPGATIADRLAAIKMMIQFGLERGIPIDVVKERVWAMIVLAESMLDQDTAEQFITKLEIIWGGEL